MKMRRCEDEKVRYRPPLLEEPCAQTLSGKKKRVWSRHGFRGCTAEVLPSVSKVAGVWRSLSCLESVML